MQQMKGANVAVAFVVLAVLCLLAVGGFKFWKFGLSSDQQVILIYDRILLITSSRYMIVHVL